MPSRIEKLIISGALLAGLIGILQYLFVTSWLMLVYPGGMIGDPASEGFHFFYNFLSDLGRVNGFGRGHNPTAPFYKATLSTAGVATILFFGALGRQFIRETRNLAAIPMMIAAVIAGVGYIGVANNPIDVNYYGHIKYVQIGFIGFWWMSVFCAIAIWRSPAFPTKYTRLIVAFLAVLGIQILIMLFGPRSWSTPGALVLQVTAQKVVVYSEIVAMLVLNLAALRITVNKN